MIFTGTPATDVSAACRLISTDRVGSSTVCCTQPNAQRTIHAQTSVRECWFIRHIYEQRICQQKPLGADITDLSVLAARILGRRFPTLEKLSRLFRIMQAGELCHLATHSLQSSLNCLVFAYAFVVKDLVHIRYRCLLGHHPRVQRPPDTT